MLKAAIFDHDGVLVDSEESQQTVWKQFFKKHRVSYTHEFIHRGLRGRTTLSIIREQFPGKTPEEIRALVAERDAMHMEIFMKQYYPVSGAAPFICKLKTRGYRLAVATSAPAPKLAYSLKRLGVHEMFDAVVTREDVAYGKPHPEVFELAVKRLKVKPSEAVVFEDSLTGVAAAEAAGIPVVLVTTSHKRREFANKNIILSIPHFDRLSFTQIEDYYL